MQILFVHPNFPAQFGPLLSRLTKREDVECIFVSARAQGHHDGVRCVLAKLRGGATRTTHYCARTFENAVWRAHSMYESCRAAKDLQPDLIVGHSGFGSTVFLQELYSCPIVNYFEFYYHPHGSDMDFRPDYPPREIDFLRSHARNAMLHLDFEACKRGYTPTHWQHGLLPEAWRPEVEVLHDGVDLDLWRRRSSGRTVLGEEVGEDVRIVTYVSRGLEAMRGFDIFVRVAKKIAAEMPNVLFVVIGSDRVCYGNDRNHVQAETFREHVLQTEQPDLSRFRFVPSVPPEKLAEVLSVSDLHVYLTTPFVLSWSLLNALACECTVLGSATQPVQEVIRHEENGLLADFFDVDEFTKQALRVLHDPAAHRPLGMAGRRTVEERYSLDLVYPKFLDLFERVLEKKVF